MSYREWLKHNGSFDHIVLAIVPKEEGDALTLRGIKEKFAAKILQAAQELGLDLRHEELDEILDRLFGVNEWPEFHISHYNFHC
jgi:hypothetical protein